MMKAMIFAAGIGSRLKPFTDCHPKALYPICGKPMLQHVINHISSAGVQEIVVNVHHFASQIKDFLKKNNNFGKQILVSDETPRLLDTGGGLLKAAKLLSASNQDTLLLHNADILTDVDFSEMERYHLQSGADVTLMVTARSSSRMLYFDEAQRLRGWQNLTTGDRRPAGFQPQRFTPLAFTGVQIVSADIFPLLKEYRATNGEVFSIIPFYLHYLSKLKIVAYKPKKEILWHDIGSPLKAMAAEQHLEFLDGSSTK